MDEVLRAELLRRAEPDQAARRAMDADAVAAADAENLPWLKQVLAESGWPGQSAVGVARLMEVYGPPEPPVLTCPGCGGDISVWLPDPGGEVAVACPACGQAFTING